MLKSFYGLKVGMGQLFDAESKRVSPVTAVKIEPLVVAGIMNKISQQVVLKLVSVRFKDAIIARDKSQIVGNKKIKFKFLKVSPEVGATYNIGDVIDIESLNFTEGMDLSVSGVSRGHGFQGVMKRHGFAGGPGGHGSNFHRAPGCSGAIRSSGKVIKGRRMPGRMGGDLVTVQGLKLVKIDKTKSCLFIRGAVPGKKHNSLFFRG